MSTLNISAECGATSVTSVTLRSMVQNGLCWFVFGERNLGHLFTVDMSRIIQVWYNYLDEWFDFLWWKVGKYAFCWMPCVSGDQISLSRAKKPWYNQEKISESFDPTNKNTFFTVPFLLRQSISSLQLWQLKKCEPHLQFSNQKRFLGVNHLDLHSQMDVSENSGTPKSSFSMGFSIINHPFWGTPIFGNIHMYPSA